MDDDQLWETGPRDGPKVARRMAKPRDKHWWTDGPLSRREQRLHDLIEMAERAGADAKRRS